MFSGRVLAWGSTSGAAGGRGRGRVDQWLVRGEINVLAKGQREEESQTKTAQFNERCKTQLIRKNKAHLKRSRMVQVSAL